MKSTKKNKTDKIVLPQTSKNKTPLTQAEIEAILVNTIRSYQKHEITLELLIHTSQEIKQYTALNSELRKVLEEIISFKMINEVLSDILSELTQEEQAEID